MTEAIQAEWTKARTVPSTFWLLAGAVAVTIALSAGVIVAASNLSKHAFIPTVTLFLHLCLPLDMSQRHPKKLASGCDRADADLGESV